MLSKRYYNDGKPFMELNALQKEMIKQLNDKVEAHTYVFEEVPCAVCKKNNFEKMSEKGRYGEYVPVVICKDCGLIQTNPRMNQESYNQFYNYEYRKMYVGKDQPTDFFVNAQYLNGKKIFRYLCKNNLIPNPKDFFVLEIGCGAGVILK